jgi:hypothetical protein
MHNFGTLWCNNPTPEDKFPDTLGHSSYMRVAMDEMAPES